jgi:hypothetical protein
MELEVVYGTNTLRGTTWGRGLWEYSLPDRENYPSILKTYISNQPTDVQPKQGIDQFVSSLIEYDGDLGSVYVEWSTDTASGIIPMSNSAEDTWVSTSPIPNFQAGIKVFFKVYAESVNSLLSETYKFMYEVKENILCTPTMNCDYGDGFQLFQLGQIDNESSCEGYSDFSSLSTELERGAQYDLTVTTGYGDQFVKVWIDYNNDLAFTEDEVIINNYEIADGEAGGSHTETINFTIPENANLGEHILRAKTNWGAEVPIDPCTETDYGETEDYTVIIQEASLGIIDNNFVLSPIIYPNPTNGNITIDMLKNHSNVVITLYDFIGKEIYKKRYGEGQMFNFSIDMPSAVYLLSIESENKKIIFRLLKN